MSGLISIIVTTYNREDALDAVLRSLAQQTDPSFEVIVADDGSRTDTAAVIDGWKRKFGRRLEHVWHEDRGFRAAEIRNRAILAARGDYCVFIDGDCIVRREFVAAHRGLAEPGWFVTGSRVLLSRALTAKVLREKQTPETWTFMRWVVERRRGGVNRLLSLLLLPLGPLRYSRWRSWTAVRTCNLAVARSDLERIDGFDADYNGWGAEDTDLVVRLLHAGVRRKLGNFAVGVLHLWHPQADRRWLWSNERRVFETMAAKRIRATHGMSTLQTTVSAEIGPASKPEQVDALTTRSQAASP